MTYGSLERLAGTEHMRGENDAVSGTMPGDMPGP